MTCPNARSTGRLCEWWYNSGGNVRVCPQCKAREYRPKHARRFKPVSRLDEITDEFINQIRYGESSFKSGRLNP